jgi:hypothetical protein
MRKADKEEALFALDALVEQTAEIGGSMDRSATVVAIQVTELARLTRQLAMILSEVVDAQTEAEA